MCVCVCVCARFIWGEYNIHVMYILYIEDNQMQVFKGPIFFPVLTYFKLEEEAENKVHIKGRAHCLWRERLYILNASDLLEFVSFF